MDATFLVGIAHRQHHLEPYPFERLRKLFAGITPPAHLAPINLSIGEPKHPTPPFILEALTKALPGIASYPLTAGQPDLREAIAAWARRRYDLRALDPATQVLPVAGSREALIAFAQTVIDRSRDALVVAPNPFYQIYEGATLLAGGRPVFLPTTAANGYRMEFDRLGAVVWARVQLVYLCTPVNPTGRVMTLPEWKQLFDLSDRYGFVIAFDECYSEIYFEEGNAPLGGLQAAAQHRTAADDSSISLYVILSPNALNPTGPDFTCMAFEHEVAHTNDFLLQWATGAPHAATPGEELAIYQQNFEWHFLDLMKIDGAACSWSIAEDFGTLFSYYASADAAARDAMFDNMRIFHEVRIENIPCNAMKYRIWFQAMLNARPAGDALAARINGLPGLALTRGDPPADHLTCPTTCT